MLRSLLDLFSSVKLGICLLIVLFLYSSIGSAGILYPARPAFWDLDNWNQIVVRHLPGLEMTEYEWFQWWPFTLLIGLICATICVTTLRRIPFRPVNFGVWMIHAGILTLAAGSVWYFSAKVEGEAAVIRRRLVIQVEGEPARSLAVLPGNHISIGDGARRHEFRIAEVNPDWEILTGDDVGQRVYAVSVSVRTPEGSFVRQLLDGHPQFTEDVIPGQGRAIQVRGTRIIDDSISLALEYEPEEHFYLAHTDAIYLREAGTREWIERPIGRLPRYNDYIGSYQEVWPIAAPSSLPLNGLAIDIPPIEAADPLAGMSLRVASYLRYAFEDTRRVAGGAFDPLVRLRLENDAGQTERIELLARDPARSSYAGGFARFVWIDDEQSLQPHIERVGGAITIAVPGSGFTEVTPFAEITANADAEGFRAIPGTAFEWRLVASENYQPDQQGELESFAIVELRSPERSWHRVVFDATTLPVPPPRDVLLADHDTEGMRELPLDSSIEIQYVPPAQVLLIGGPEESLRVVRPTAAGAEPIVTSLAEGSRFEIGSSLALVVEEFSKTSHFVTRPVIVPNAQRRRELDLQFRMIRVELPGPAGSPPISIWLTYHEFPFASEADALPGYPYEPAMISLSDGRRIELLYSRQRAPLPAPVVLEDFDVAYHVGGFSGDNLSVDEWNSYVRFDTKDGLSAAQAVAVNQPGAHEGYWFFQSRWDPPGSASGKNGAPSAGLNFTVLGVGNRDGVYVQLAGCAIAVIGMLYAFYVKPIIKRRHRELALARLHADGGHDATENIPAPQPDLVEAHA